MKGKVRPGRQRWIVSVDFSDPKNPGGRASVALGFAQTGFVLAGEAATPGETFLAEKNRDGVAQRAPGTRVVALEPLQRAAHRVPVRGQRDNQLLTIVRDTGGTRGAGDEKQPCRQKQSSRHP